MGSRERMVWLLELRFLEHKETEGTKAEGWMSGLLRESGSLGNSVSIRLFHRDAVGTTKPRRAWRLLREVWGRSMGSRERMVWLLELRFLEHKETEETKAEGWMSGLLRESVFLGNSVSIRLFHRDAVGTTKPRRAWRLLREVWGRSMGSRERMGWFLELRFFEQEGTKGSEVEGWMSGLLRESVFLGNSVSIQRSPGTASAA